MGSTSTPWALLPATELGCGSATTCWCRLDEWAKAGAFGQLQALALDELGVAGRIDLERVSVDSFSLRTVKGDLTGAKPTDRGKQGSKLHLAGDAGGLPPALPRLAAPARKQAADRPADGRLLSSAGPSPLDDRTDRRMAGWLPAAADPL